MGKLLTFAAVLATLGLARADDKAAPPAQADAPAAAAPAQPAPKRSAPAKKARKNAAARTKAAKAKDAKGAQETRGSAKEKPCEPVKPCPID